MNVLNGFFGVVPTSYCFRFFFFCFYLVCYLEEAGRTTRIACLALRLEFVDFYKRTNNLIIIELLYICFSCLQILYKLPCLVVYGCVCIQCVRFESEGLPNETRIGVRSRKTRKSIALLLFF